MMSAVQVTVHNNSDQKVSITVDDERDAERIEYLQTLKRRGDIKDVQVRTASVQQKASGPKRKASGDASASDAS